VAAERMVSGVAEPGDSPLTPAEVAELNEEPVPPEEILGRGGQGSVMAGTDTLASLGSLVNSADLYCSVCVVEDLVEFPYQITGSEERDKIGLTLDDVVYIDAGSVDGIKAGDLFLIAGKEKKIRHPESHRNMGWAMRYLGQLTILCARENDASAVITGVCSSIESGSLLKAWEEIPFPVIEQTAPRERCDEPSGDNEGFIVYCLDEQAAFGAGRLVVIDRGSDSGTTPGDFFTIYRMNLGQRVVLGELVVLVTGRQTATAKVTSSLTEMYVGDRLELK